jgi:predicted CXXCH cytochrome family protein
MDRGLYARSSLPVLRLITVVLLLVTMVRAHAGATYDTSKHGNPSTGVLRVPELGPGACAQCHELHGSRDGISNGGPFEQLLFSVADETLCYSCHSSEGSSFVYPGNVVWADSSHSTSPSAYWRGPSPAARPASDAGKCVNCHDPHAVEDADGVVPSMLRLREQDLCLGCHDGVAAADVVTDVAKTYTHPFSRSSRHTAAEGNTNEPHLYDDAGGDARRHAECADCHNAHVARSDFGATVAPDASPRLHGVARVKVINGAAGSIPTYAWRGAADLIDPREYEICFKCHSSWTDLPLGKPDLARLTNPNNPSFHPVQARGVNAGIHPAAFENGWTWDSRVYCADCHGSDDPLVAGVHGSSHRHLLRKSYTASTTLRSMGAEELCFSCHRFDVYAVDASPDATQQLSRFNRPSNNGHAAHVGAQQVPCFVCHATHGSTSQASLIATGRTPGILSYSQNAGGGSCTPTCHVTRTWTVNYGR